MHGKYFVQYANYKQKYAKQNCKKIVKLICKKMEYMQYYAKQINKKDNQIYY